MAKRIEVPIVLELANDEWIKTETTIGDKELQARVRREMRLTKPEWEDLEAYWKHHGGPPKSLFKEEQEHIAALSRGQVDP